MILMNPRLALITLTVVPVLAIIIFIWQRYARRAFISVRRAIATVNSQLQEDIAGVRVVQSLSREEENFEQFNEVNRDLDANVTAVKLEALMMPTVNILTGVAFAILIIIGGYQVLHKWLKDRKGRTLSYDDVTHYGKIVVALKETIRLMQEIDEVIDEHGGWPDAFATAPNTPKTKVTSPF